MERASRDRINSGFSKAIGFPFIFFACILSIILSWVLSGKPIYAESGVYNYNPETAVRRSGVYRESLPAWEISPKKWDRWRSRWDPSYVIEGLGAARIRLGENEEQVRARLGPPASRDYGFPEQVVFFADSIQVTVTFRAGITERIAVEPMISQVLFETALGAHAEDFEGKTYDDQLTLLKERYPAAALRSGFGEVDIYSRGIKFFFKDEKLVRVEVFRPYRLP